MDSKIHNSQDYYYTYNYYIIVYCLFVYCCIIV